MQVLKDFWVGKSFSRQQFLPMSTAAVFVKYYTKAYRFFRDVHAKHVLTASNMMSRQWSAAECGDCDGRQPVSPTRAYAIPGRAVSGLIFLILANCSLFHWRDDDDDGRTDASPQKNNRKTAASDYITSTRTHTTTTAAVVTAASGSNGSSSIVVP